MSTQTPIKSDRPHAPVGGSHQRPAAQRRPPMPPHSASIPAGAAAAANETKTTPMAESQARIIATSRSSLRTHVRAREPRRGLQVNPATLRAGPALSTMRVKNDFGFDGRSSLTSSPRRARDSEAFRRSAPIDRRSCCFPAAVRRGTRERALSTEPQRGASRRSEKPMSALNSAIRSTRALRRFS